MGLACGLVLLTAACGARPVSSRGPAGDASGPFDGANDNSTGDRQPIDGGSPPPDGFADSGADTDRPDVSADVGTDTGVDGTGGGPADGAPGERPIATCPPAAGAPAPAAPLQRLTNFEYSNTVRDLLSDLSRPADTLPFDGESNDVDDPGRVVSELLIEKYHDLAHDFALKATENTAAVAALIRCDVAALGEAACQQTFIETLVPRAFRRAIDPTDISDFNAVFAEGRKLGGDFASGVRAVVEVMLQSPEFLYRIELGQAVGAAQPSLARPTSYEMAARLSYLLWGSVPDEPLRAAAARDELRTKEQIAAQARRMIDDARARELVRYFYFQRLHLNRPDALGHLRPRPDVSPQLPDLLLRETAAFIDGVTWRSPGNFRALLTAPYTFMNAPLARFYGVPGIDGDALQEVPLDVTKRGGLLTQASVLALNSGSSTTSPSRRGAFVFREFMCGQLMPEPDNVSVPPPEPTKRPDTTRQAFQLHVSQPACAECHRDMDPLGFAFEHFDELGLWRDQENGFPIDASGAIFQTDARGMFNGAVELAQRLADSRDAQNCFITQWMSFGYHRSETAADACSHQSLFDTFTQTQGNVKELLVALTQTDAFLFRPITP